MRVLLVAFLIATLAAPAVAWSWEDAKDLYEGAKDAASDLTGKLADEFGELSDTVKEGLGNAADFVKLTADDLKTLPDDLLAGYEGLKDMTTEQLSGLADKISSMDSSDFSSFVEKVNPQSLYDSLEDLGKQSWDVASADKIISKVKSLYGEASSWSTDQLDKFGTLIEGISVDDLAQIKDDVFAKASYLGNMTAEQLAALKEKCATMSKDDIVEFYDSTAPDALKDAIEKGLVKIEWAGEHAEGLFERLQKSDLYGDLSTWDESTWSDLKNVSGSILMQGVERIKNINPTAFNESCDIIGDALLKAKDFTDATLEKKKKTLADLTAKATEAFGDAKEWTADTIVKAGPALLELDMSAVTSEALTEAISSGLGDNFNWEAVKGAADDFATRVKESDVLGEASQWTSANLENLKGLLPVVASAEDLKAVAEDTFKNSLAELKDLCESNSFDKEQLTALADRAKEVYSSVSEMTKEHVEELGGILAGLESSDLANLASDALKGLSNKTVALLDSEQLAALKEKIGDLSTEAKDSIRAKVMNQLSEEQKKLLFGCKDESDCLVLVELDVDLLSPIDTAKWEEKLKNIIADAKNSVLKQKEGEFGFVYRFYYSTPEKAVEAKEELELELQPDTMVGTQALVQAQVEVVSPTAAPGEDITGGATSTGTSVISLLLCAVVSFATANLQ